MIVNCCNPQPKRINKPQRIAFHIPIGIQPPSQPNRVALDIAPCPRVIVPEVVVVQPRIGIEHLPGKAQGDVGGNAVLVARVRQLRAQVFVFVRAHFQKCHYNSANCSGAAGLSIPNA